tara:strand:+ start:86 stop:694 length:609 start_codon:yes stop_codon:yes gene_type:complete
MILNVEPEKGVPFPDNKVDLDLAKRVEAAAKTSEKLFEHGMIIKPTTEDKDTAAAIATSYAADPETTSKTATPSRVATLTPASLVLTNNILTEFGQSVADSATQIRHLVTNKLLLETENPDARYRLRALELLGKISDVGLFAEKSEVTITHQTTEDLRAKLRGKLEKLVKPVEDIVDAVVIEDDEFCIDEELGDISEIEYDD